jgi:hypothetical protein
VILPLGQLRIHQYVERSSLPQLEDPVALNQTENKNIVRTDLTSVSKSQAEMPMLIA